MAEQKNMEEAFKKELSKQFYDVVRSIVVSEKTTRQIEFENKMVFEVSKAATKPLLKLLIETEFGKKVKKINTVNSITGKKRAIITFVEEGVASDLASELGMV
jgi:ribosomal protein L23